MSETHNCTQRENITKLQTEVKAIFKRMDEQTALAKSVTELAASIKIMAVEMQTLRDDITEVKGDVKEMKAKPAKRWESLVGTVIAVIVTAVVTFLLTQAGIGG